MATRTPARYRADIDRRSLRPSDSTALSRCTATRGDVVPIVLHRSWLRSRVRRQIFLFTCFRPKAQVMNEQANKPACDCQISQPLQRVFPQFHAERNARIAG